MEKQKNNWVAIAPIVLSLIAGAVWVGDLNGRVRTLESGDLFSQIDEAKEKAIIEIKNKTPATKQLDEDLRSIENKLETLRSDYNNTKHVTHESDVPSGTIIAWFGGTDNFPKGWLLCNGDNDTPDLSNRFLMGVDRIGEIGSTGGINKIDEIASGNHILTIEQIPSHSHTYVDNHYHISKGINRGSGNGGHKDTSKTTSAIGGSKPHSHKIPEHDNRPNYIGVIFLMKE